MTSMLLDRGQPRGDRRATGPAGPAARAPSPDMLSVVSSPSPGTIADISDE